MLGLIYGWLSLNFLRLYRGWCKSFDFTGFNWKPIQLMWTLSRWPGTNSVSTSFFLSVNFSLWQPPDGSPCTAELSEASPKFTSKLSSFKNLEFFNHVCGWGFHTGGWENWHRTRSWWRANVGIRERSTLMLTPTLTLTLFIVHNYASSATPLLLLCSSYGESTATDNAIHSSFVQLHSLRLVVWYSHS